MQNYTHAEKKKLAEELRHIKKKKYLNKIGKIIIKHNNKFVENNNGTFMFFNNFTNETYDELKHLLFKIKKKNEFEKKNELSEKSLSDSNYQPYISDEHNLSNESSFKLSNKEKNLIKRKEYSKKLDNEDNIYN
jgi:hypothetical protein